MDSFLDTNIIINFAKYNQETKEGIVIKCHSYIINKKNNFIVCYAVIHELSNFMEKLTLIHRIVLDNLKKENPAFNSKDLSKKDLLIAEKLYLLNKDKDMEELKKTFSMQRDILEIKIEQFLKTKIDKKVILSEEIDNQLANRICDIIFNYADSKILASALQYQKDKAIFLFVTSDKKHLDPNGYDFLQEQFKINPPKETYKFPQLLNLTVDK